MELGTIILRTLGTYFLILIIFRLMGKREIGELSILDLVVFVMLAEIAVFSIEEPENNILHAVVPMLILLTIQRGSALLSLKSQTMRQLLDGKPSIIIKKGKIDEHEMKKQRYNYDDLMMQLREEGIQNIADVSFGVLETSGKLSVFEKKSSEGDDSSSDNDEKNREQGFILPLIADGKIQKDNLKANGKDIQWLYKELKRRGYNKVEDISFLTIDDQKEWYIDEKNEKI